MKTETKNDRQQKKKVLSRISTLDVIVQCVSLPVISMSNLEKKARAREKKTEGEKVIDRYLRASIKLQEEENE